MKPDKPLKDCFLCSICKEAPGFLPPWDSWVPGSQDVRSEIMQPLMCKRCIKAFARVKSHSGAHVEGLHAMLAWAAKRARDAEHRRMTDKVNGLELKLRVEIATTNAIIRKYGNTTTEIGDMNSAK